MRAAQPHTPHQTEEPAVDHHHHTQLHHPPTFHPATLAVAAGIATTHILDALTTAAAITTQALITHTNTIAQRHHLTHDVTATIDRL